QQVVGCRVVLGEVSSPFDELVLQLERAQRAVRSRLNSSLRFNDTDESGQCRPRGKTQQWVLQPTSHQRDGGVTTKPRSIRCGVAITGAAIARVAARSENGQHAPAGRGMVGAVPLLDA